MVREPQYVFGAATYWPRQYPEIKCQLCIIVLAVILATFENDIIVVAIVTGRIDNYAKISLLWILLRKVSPLRGKK